MRGLRRRTAAGIAAVCCGALLVLPPLAARWWAEDADALAYAAGQVPLQGVGSAAAQGDLPPELRELRLRRAQGLAEPELPPKAPAPPPGPHSETIEIPREHSRDDAQVAASRLLKSVQRRLSNRGCHGMHVPPTHADSRLFGDARGSDAVIRHLLHSACSKREKMKEKGLAAPLYADVGPGAAARAAQLAVVLGCRVLALEPSPSAAQRAAQLLRNASHAARRAGVPPAGAEVRRLAVDAEPGRVRLRVSRDETLSGGDALHGGRTQYEPGAWWHSKLPHAVVDAEAATLDQALGNESLISILRIDTRGRELDAMRGAARLLGSHRVQALVLRFWPAGCDSPRGWRRGEAVMLLRRLHYLGYSLHRSDVESLHVRSPPDPPDCAAELVDYLSDSVAADAFGLWVDIVALK